MDATRPSVRGSVRLSHKMVRLRSNKDQNVHHSTPLSLHSISVNVQVKNAKMLKLYSAAKYPRTVTFCSVTDRDILDVKSQRSRSMTWKSWNRNSSTHGQIGLLQGQIALFPLRPGAAMLVVPRTAHLFVIVLFYWYVIRPYSCHHRHLARRNANVLFIYFYSKLCSAWRLSTDVLTTFSHDVGYFQPQQKFRV